MQWGSDHMFQTQYTEIMSRLRTETQAGRKVCDSENLSKTCSLSCGALTSGIQGASGRTKLSKTPVHSHLLKGICPSSEMTIMEVILRACPCIFSDSSSPKSDLNAASLECIP